MNLPSAPELASDPSLKTRSPQELNDAIDLATRAAELLTGVDIRERQRGEHLLVLDGNLKLRYFPVHDVSIGQLKLSGDDLTGTYFHELEPCAYDVTYYIGYKAKMLPAIVYEAILHLAKFRLTGDVTYRDEALLELEVIRENREKAVRNR